MRNNVLLNTAERPRHKPSYAETHVTQQEIEAARKACRTLLQTLRPLYGKIKEELPVEPGPYRFAPEYFPPSSTQDEGFYAPIISLAALWGVEAFLKYTPHSIDTDDED